MKYTLGFSPCPNDTFIFDALLNSKIDRKGLDFEVRLEDVQTLNELAIQGKLDISKISYASLPLLQEQYRLLTSGGALGKGVGPLLISKFPIPEPALRQCTVAIPGQNTTANLLFSLAYPEATNKVFLRFDEIEEFVLGSADDLESLQKVKLGVIIHENRFTYASKGLVKLADLGELWETQTGLPIPLGGIVVKKNIEPAIAREIDQLIRQSIDYAFSNYPEIPEYVKEHSQEMSESVMRDHIQLYVNDFSRDLGEEGKKSVKKFLQIHSSIHKLPLTGDDIFI